MKTKLITDLAVLSVVVVLWAFKSSEQEKDYTECLIKYRSAWGEYCENCNNIYKNSYKVFFRNECGEKIDVKVGVQDSISRKWKTFYWSEMAPGDTMVAYACDGNGKYLKWVRKAGDNFMIFPSDDKINAENKE